MSQRNNDIISIGHQLKTDVCASSQWWCNKIVDEKYLGVNSILQKELLRGFKRQGMSDTHQRKSTSGFSSYQKSKFVPAWSYQLLPNLSEHYQKVHIFMIVRKNIFFSRWHAFCCIYLFNVIRIIFATFFLYFVSLVMQSSSYLFSSSEKTFAELLKQYLKSFILKFSELLILANVETALFISTMSYKMSVPML